MRGRSGGRCRRRGGRARPRAGRRGPVTVTYEPYEGAKLERLTADAAAATARYPDPRSALLPLLHLVQSEDGYVSPDGIAFCAATLGLSTAEVSAVATFYTQYKRHPNGTYTVGVCTNTLCAVMGGDAIYEELSHHLGIGHDETTDDGAITLERVECNAACDYAPVVMVNWEFFDNQTPASATQVVDRLRAGELVAPTRGASSVATFREMSRVLAGFSDGRADEGVGAGVATLRGTTLAKEKGWSAPAGVGAAPQAAAPATDTIPASTGSGAPHSSVDTPAAPPTGGTADTPTGRDAGDPKEA
ncbi:MAG: NADH-quinone oxidoreductase subunit NuoE [Cellulomonadaceae bacterium]|nr:NADH-quinone oxidoreductase subunit NuoE [Cellulomonadaceae bacterium]